MADRLQFEKVIVMGGSAGAVEPMQNILASLPADFPSPVLVVVHVGEISEMHLTLTKDTRLSAKKVRGGERVQAGHVYVAPSGRHLCLQGRTIQLIEDRREKRWQPSVDCLFESAAKAFGDKVIAVVLSGSLDDGTKGAQALHDVDACLLAQHPDEATFPSMPMNVIRRDHPSRILRTDQIASELVRLAG
jgi:two-component system chemotaxis response regulator CheB